MGIRYPNSQGGDYLGMGRDFNGNEIAKIIFNCLIELKIRYGLNYVTSVLSGSKSERILNRHHDQLANYGVLKHYSFEQIKLLLIELVEQGYIFQTRDQYPVLFLLEKAKQVLAGNGQVSLKEPNPELARKFGEPGESIDKTVTLFKAGKSIDDIAKERNLAVTTIVSHLAFAYEHGAEVNIDQFVPAEKQETIKQAFQKMGTEYLTPVKQSLGMSYSWEDLKLVRAKFLRQTQAAS